MERRKAIKTAAAASLTLVAGAAGIALSSGVIGDSGDSKVGQLTPVASDGQPITVYFDEATGTFSTAPPVQPSDAAPVATSAASGRDDDEEHEDDEDEDDDREHDDRGQDDEEHEYEGGEDDD